jgi:methyl-accepting chemotaxis protein
MSTHPSLEARVRALEHRQFNLETHTEELVGGLATSIKSLSDDMTASFKQMVNEQVKTEGQVDARFNQMDTRLNQLESVLNQHTAVLNQHTAVLNQHTAALDHHTSLLTQILERLPKNP